MPKYRISGIKNGEKKSFVVEAADENKAWGIAMENRVTVKKCRLVEREEPEKKDVYDDLAKQADNLVSICDLMIVVFRAIEGLVVFMTLLGMFFAPFSGLEWGILVVSLAIFVLAGEFSLIGVRFYPTDDA